MGEALTLLGAAGTRPEILASVDVAETALARGKGRVITEESVRDLAAEVKQRGRARLTAERAAKT
jgi:hypothetical protein